MKRKAGRASDLSSDPKMNRLAELLRGVKPGRLRMLLAKDAVVTFRCSDSDKQEIQRVASECNVSVSEYLLRLHYIAAGLLETQAKRRGQRKRS